MSWWQSADTFERDVKRTVGCPRCKAEAGQQCRNLTEPRRRASHPHAARVAAYDRWERKR